MENLSASWEKGGLFICEKCGRREDRNMQNPGAESYKTEFKAQLRDMGHGKKIRVMVSGCLGPCPPNKQAAAFFPTVGPVEIVAFDPASEKQKFWSWILSKLG